MNASYSSTTFVILYSKLFSDFFKTTEDAVQFLYVWCPDTPFFLSPPLWSLCSNIVLQLWKNTADSGQFYMFHASQIWEFWPPDPIFSFCAMNPPTDFQSRAKFVSIDPKTFSQRKTHYRQKSWLGFRLCGIFILCLSSLEHCRAHFNVKKCALQSPRKPLVVVTVRHQRPMQSPINRFPNIPNSARPTVCSFSSPFQLAGRR